MFASVKNESQVNVNICRISILTRGTVCALSLSKTLYPQLSTCSTAMNDKLWTGM